MSTSDWTRLSFVNSFFKYGCSWSPSFFFLHFSDYILFLKNFQMQWNIFFPDPDWFRIIKCCYFVHYSFCFVASRRLIGMTVSGFIAVLSVSACVLLLCSSLLCLLDFFRPHFPLHSLNTLIHCQLLLCFLLFAVSSVELYCRIVLAFKLI